jgi:hypothetical protein
VHSDYDDGDSDGGMNQSQPAGAKGGEIALCLREELGYIQKLASLPPGQGKNP